MPPQQRPLAERTVVLTGGTSGIGRATAVSLAGLGLRLLLVGRDPARAEETLAVLEERTGRTDVDVVLGDFASLDDVRRLADEIARRTSRIDVLLNNAGLTLTSRQTSMDGHERTFAVNHLAPFLLTGLLLPRILAAGPARIVNVASEAHRFGRIDWDDVQNERRYSGLRVYGQSKTANLLFTRELARRLDGTDVTVNALHPGGIRSNLGRGNGAPLDGVQRVVGLFLRSPEQGARTSVHLATSDDVLGKTGGYYASCRPKKAAAHAFDDTAARRLWQISEELTGMTYDAPAASPS
jgi:retinol dehydrogenase-14